MAYTADANDITNPLDTVDRSTAAAEFRTLKTALSTISTVASATTPDIFATAALTINYTGTAVATGFAAAANAGQHERTLVCAGAAQFTAGANLLIDGTASGDTLTVAAGTIFKVLAITATQFRMIQLYPVVASSSINISATTSTDTTTQVVLVGAAATGNQLPFIDSGLTYNANTNTLTAAGFVGDLVGNADTATSATSATSATTSAALTNGGALNTPASGALDNCTSNTESVGTNNTQLATTAYCMAGFVNNDTDVADIGCYALSYHHLSGAWAAGDTIAGSSISSVCLNAGGFTPNTARNGTWRNVSGTIPADAAEHVVVTQRIA